MPVHTMRTSRGRPRRTRIIATLGPASSDESMISRLIETGMNVARINCSHGTMPEREAIFHRIRSVARELDRTVAILMDLSGPKMRVRDIPAGFIDLVVGTEATFVRGDADATKDAITTTYDALIDDLQRGDPVFLDDGNIKLRVLRKDDTSATCIVEVGGQLKPRKGLNLPGSKVSVASMTDKDIEDLEHGCRLGADFFALSFVREARNLQELRDRMLAFGGTAKLVAKIEKPQALDVLEEIIDASDAIMVARGDLGVELPVEQVPSIQKRIIRQCRKAMKPVIVATQMLESMILNPRPTRAEVSDVANAITDGCDAIMLSGETAAGSYPLEAVAVMAEVANITEKELLGEQFEVRYPKDARGDSYRMAIAQGAANIADALGAKFLVVRSESGVTARYFSKLRPRVPVIACNPNDDVLRKHALYWGVIPVRTSRDETESPTMEEELRFLARELFNQGLAGPVDNILVVSSFPWGDSRPPNSLRAIRVGEAVGAL